MERLEEEIRIQAVIDSGSDISEVDEVFANYLKLSDEDKEKISEAMTDKTDDYIETLIIGTVEEKQCVKGKNEILLKVKINSLKGDELRLGVIYKKDKIDVLYTDYFMVIGKDGSI